MPREGTIYGPGVLVCASLLLAASPAVSQCAGSEGGVPRMGMGVELREGLARRISNLSQPLVIWSSVTMMALPQARARETGQRAADALLVTAAATSLVKQLTHQLRPDNPDPGLAALSLAPAYGYDSFPSGHASMAFAYATVMTDADPDNRWLWYGLAGSVAWSRVQLNAHHVRDVVAGAALGTYLARCCLRSEDGMLLPVGPERKVLQLGEATVTLGPSVGPEGIEIITVEF